MTGVPRRRQIGNWRDAEENAAEWMRHWGFDDAAVTPEGVDGGIDVASDGAIAQVKFEASQVGRPSLQRLVGARGRNQTKVLLFFTGTDFSTKAREYANELQMALFRYRLDGAMEALNVSAQRIANGQEAGGLRRRDTTVQRELRDVPARAVPSHAAIARAEGLLRDLTSRDRAAVIDALLLGKPDVALQRYRQATGARLLDAENLVRKILEELR